MIESNKFSRVGLLLSDVQQGFILDMLILLLKT